MPLIILGIFVLGLSVLVADFGKECIKGGMRELEDKQRQLE